jgi:hypothetical protein
MLEKLWVEKVEISKELDVEPALLEKAAIHCNDRDLCFVSCLCLVPAQ